MPNLSFGISRGDVENALNIATVAQLYDDGDGKFNLVAFNANVLRGEQELVSYLIGIYGMTLPSDLAGDPFLKSSALDFVVGYSVGRHPEYAKAQGFGTKTEYFELASARAERVVSGRQRATTADEPPKNVGGPVVNGCPRMYIPDANGRENAGDF